MDEIITLASDEEDIKSPPKKRIKPILLANLPNVSITKIPKKRQEVVILSSDDDSDSENNKETEEMANGTNGKKISEDNQEKCIENNDIIQIVDDGDISEINNTTSDSVVILDIDNESGDVEIMKNVEDSCETTKVDGGEEGQISGSSELDQLQPESSSANKPSNTILLGNFLKIIEEKTQEGKYSVVKEKIPLVLSYYSKCENALGDCNTFKTLLLTCTDKAGKTAALAVKSFHDVYQHLKENVNTGSIEVEKHHKPLIHKLEQKIKLLIKVIKHQEEQEVDFDQEEDSSFLKLEKYNCRLDKLYKKYCKLLKKNPYNGRLTYSKLDFVDSEYNEINRAISKKFDNRKFPSYYEMEKFIEKVVKDNDLKLNEEIIKKESIHCFKRLGELLQTRRRKELYDSHLMLIKDTEDPAKENPELTTILKNNYVEGQQKLEKLVDGYVSRQENKSENASASSSSEDNSDEGNSIESEDDPEDEDDGKL